MAVDWTGVAWNIIDALLMGIPSAVAVPEIQKDYNVEISDLNKLYNLLQKEYNNLSDQGLSKEALKANIKEAMYGTNPLGDWRRILEDKYQGLGSEISRIDSQKQDLNEKIKKTADSISDVTKEAADATYMGNIVDKAADKFGLNVQPLMNKDKGFK